MGVARRGRQVKSRGSTRAPESAARGRLVELECAAAVWEGSVALLGMPRERWRDYRQILEHLPVPGSAGMRPFYGAVLREWRPSRPVSPWWPLWPPVMLFVLVALVEMTEGAPWAVTLLRGFCRRQVATRLPPGCQRGRPSYHAFWCAVSELVRQERSEGDVSWPRIKRTMKGFGWTVSHSPRDLKRGFEGFERRLSSARPGLDRPTRRRRGQQR
jgi:hypothetical protein